MNWICWGDRGKIREMRGFSPIRTRFFNWSSSIRAQNMRAKKLKVPLTWQSQLDIGLEDDPVGRSQDESRCEG